MPRLRRVDCSSPGIVRRRRGRGFEYARPDGRRVTDRETLDRITGLAVPPAWNDVWISVDPLGHLQAVGTDAAGRRQYRYHPLWRVRRDQAKFDHMLEFARVLPVLREATQEHLARPKLDRERVLACAARLLDLGFFRVGGEDYAEQNGTFGLATILKEHVSVSDGEVVFDYPAKGAKRRVQSVADDAVRDVVRRLKRRRGGGPELLAYRQDGRWVDVRSTDVNDYIREATGGEFTSKDFRTWNATVLAAAVLAGMPAATSRTGRRRTESATVRRVAEYLGNTPAVCRSSYVDPRVFDRYRAGVTIGRALGALPGAGEAWRDVAARNAVEAAVLALIEEEPEESAA